MSSSKRSTSKRGNEESLDNDSKRRKTTPNVAQDMGFLASVQAFILQAGIEKMRYRIFVTQLEKYGGATCKELTDDVTHLIIDDKMEVERMCRILKLESPPQNVPILKSSWLSSCFREKAKVDTTSFVIDVPKVSPVKDDEENKVDNAESGEGEAMQYSATDAGNKSQKLAKVGFMFGHKCKVPEAKRDSGDEDSDYCPSDGEDKKIGDALSDSDRSTNDTDSRNPSPQKYLNTGSWICAQSSKTQQENVNKHITDKLEEMVKTYESTNDKWRAFGYQKAVQILKKQSKPITTFEEAKALPNVGKRLAEKIWEIAESGELRKLNELRSSEDIRVIEQFKDVWGAGAHTARAWYQQGLRSLADLKEKGNLTYQQKIGLKHYDDFLDRMPRSEAGQIEQVVKEAAESIQEGVIAQACGSYRRGKETCGDVDVLITHPDGKSHKGLFGKVLAKLKDQGFLTDDLVTAEDNGNQKKYLGVCKLPGEGQRYRRIDIIVVPYDEYACALVYFTGSAHLNRSLRHLAKKMGMSLSEHSLNEGVVRKGAEKVYEGTPVPTPTEESVFVRLGVPFRPPEERDH